jgi:hypothetical protein
VSRSWTTREVVTLRALRVMGAKSLARDLGRTVASVKSKARELGISLRIPGSRLASASRIGDVMRLVANRRIDMEVVLERMRLDAIGELAVCPHCGKRPAVVKRTGLCGTCHKALLIEHLNDELATYEAQQQQWVAQQRLSRMRRAAANDGS